MAHLRAELLLREENYNKHFKNGGAGEKVLSVGAALNAQAGGLAPLGGPRPAQTCPCSTNIVQYALSVLFCILAAAWPGMYAPSVHNLVTECRRLVK
jgi:hypothetical protein